MANRAPDPDRIDEEGEFITKFTKRQKTQRMIEGVSFASYVIL